MLCTYMHIYSLKPRKTATHLACIYFGKIRIKQHGTSGRAELRVSLLLISIHMNDFSLVPPQSIE